MNIKMVFGGRRKYNNNTKLISDDFLLCKDLVEYDSYIFEKTRIVFDQATSLLVGVSGEAGFLRMISDFVRKKS